MPLDTAAAELGVTQRTLETWIADGAPVARRGGRGRGRCTLVDCAAIRAWRRSAGAEDALQALAAEVPALLADAMHEALTLAEGPHKRQLAGALAGAWYVATTAVLDRLRNEAEDVPELDALPEKITRFLRISEHSGTVETLVYGDHDDA